MKQKIILASIIAATLAVSATGCGSVQPSIEGIILPETIEIPMGETAIVVPYFDMGDMDVSEETLDSLTEDAEFIWHSSDETVLTVSTDGLVSGIREGEAEIKAEMKDTGYTASCTVIVKAVPQSQLVLVNEDAPIRLDSNAADHMNVNALLEQFNVTVPEGTDLPVIEWTTTDESKAVIDENGSITASGEVGNFVVIASAQTPEGSSWKVGFSFFMDDMAANESAAELAPPVAQTMPED